MKVLRFFRQKQLRFFEDKTSKTLKFRGEDEDSIFEEFYRPTLRGGVALFGDGSRRSGVLAVSCVLMGLCHFVGQHCVHLCSYKNIMISYVVPSTP